MIVSKRGRLVIKGGVAEHKSGRRSAVLVLEQGDDDPDETLEVFFHTRTDMDEFIKLLAQLREHTWPPERQH